MNKDNQVFQHFKRDDYYMDEYNDTITAIENSSIILLIAVSAINLISTIIYLCMNMANKISRKQINGILWTFFLTLNIFYIVLNLIFAIHGIAMCQIELPIHIGTFIFFLALNYLIYIYYLKKSKLEKDEIIASLGKNKPILNKGKGKASEVTLNNDDSNKSIDPPPHQEIDIIDIEKSENKTNNSSNSTMNNANNSVNNNINNSISNFNNSINNSINNINSNINNNNNISSDALLQHINYLQNYIVSNMPSNNDVPPPVYYDNYANGSFSGINNNNNNNDNIKNSNNVNNINNINNNNYNNVSSSSTPTTSTPPPPPPPPPVNNSKRDEKHGDLSLNLNINTNNNNDNILPSYSEYIKHTSPVYPLNPVSLASAPSQVAPSGHSIVPLGSVSSGHSTVPIGSTTAATPSGHSTVPIGSTTAIPSGPVLLNNKSKQ